MTHLMLPLQMLAPCSWRWLFAAVVIAVAAAQADQLSSFPIDWDSVPASPSESRNLDSPYLGECVCDVTNGLCDPLCCCDQDCPVTKRTRFSECLAERFGYPPIVFCSGEADDSARLSRESRGQDAIDQNTVAQSAVCIIRANRPNSIWRFFTVPNSVAAPPIAFTTDPETTTTGLQVLGTMPTTKIVSVTTSDGSTVPQLRNSGTFSLPTVRANGLCSAFRRSARFMNPIDNVYCRASGEWLCREVPVASLVYEALRSPGSPIFGDQSLTPIVVTIVSATTEVELEVVDPSDAIRWILADAASGSDGSAGPPPLINTRTATVIVGTTCVNAIARAEVLFRYSDGEESRVASAAMTLFVQDVPLASEAQLVFSTTFAAVNQSVPVVVHSGSPGYITGFRVRAGTLTEANDGRAAISERMSGLAVPSSGGPCSRGRFRSIRFLYDVLSSGCTVTLSEEDLRTLCESQTGTYPLLLEVLGETDATMINRIARTSDALINDTVSWIPLEVADLTGVAPGPYDSYNRKCSNLVIGLAYNFVIARAGLTSNPQDIIVGAFLRPIIGAWKISNGTDFSASATGRLSFRFTVSFVRLETSMQSTAARRIVAPSILPPLDSSVFYPFGSPRN